MALSILSIRLFSFFLHYSVYFTAILYPRLPQSVRSVEQQRGIFLMTELAAGRPGEGITLSSLLAAFLKKHNGAILWQSVSL